jgi:hypothetical protein
VASDVTTHRACPVYQNAHRRLSFERFPTFGYTLYRITTI